MSGLLPCRWTVIRCKERDFQRFLGVDGEQAAARRVKEVCEVGSRTELDSDPTAAARWDERIRKAYLRHQQQKTNNEDNQEI